MTASTICILVTISLYLLMMICIGAFFSKINKSTDDFYLGGRRLGPLVAAMSAEASDMSSWLLLGLPGLALVTGLAEASWTAIGLAIGTYLNWLFVAKRLRVYTQKINAVTIPDFFAKRFGDDKHLLTLLSAVIIVVFFVPYTASGFAACGKLFSTMFGMDYVQTMLISAAVIVLYCTLGGFLAASTTDFVQSIIMTIALVSFREDGKSRKRDLFEDEDDEEFIDEETVPAARADEADEAWSPEIKRKQRKALFATDEQQEPEIPDLFEEDDADEEPEIIPIRAAETLSASTPFPRTGAAHSTAGAIPLALPCIPIWPMLSRRQNFPVQLIILLKLLPVWIIMMSLFLKSWSATSRIFWTECAFRLIDWKGGSP